MSGTFGRASRLREHGTFVTVQRTGRRVSARFVTLVGRPNALAADRLGVIASRRFGGAVVRNRAKRRLREIFRRRTVDVSAARRWDVVAIPKPDFVTAPFSVIEADFLAAFARLRR